MLANITRFDPSILPLEQDPNHPRTRNRSQREARRGAEADPVAGRVGFGPDAVVGLSV
jgi:hypothetical protein